MAPILYGAHLLGLDLTINETARALVAGGIGDKFILNLI